MARGARRRHRRGCAPPARATRRSVPRRLLGDAALLPRDRRGAADPAAVRDARSWARATSPSASSSARSRSRRSSGGPIGGRLADRRGRKTVHIAGMAICVVAGLLLFLPFGVAGLIFARLVVGLGDGWVFTAGVTWIVDLAPEERRGQAIGMFGLAIWGGLTFGSVLGEGVYALGGYDAVWALRGDRAAARAARRADSCPEAAPQRQPVNEEIAAAELGAAIVDARRGTAGDAPATARLRAVRPARGAAARRGARARERRLRDDGRVRRAAARPARHRPRGHRLHRVRRRRSSSRACCSGACPTASARGARRSAPASSQGLGLIAVGLAQSLPAALAAAALMGMGMSLLFPSLALLVVDRVARRAPRRGDGRVHRVLRPRRGLGAPFAGLVASLAGGEYPVAFYVGGALLRGAARSSAGSRPAASSSGAVPA